MDRAEVTELRFENIYRLTWGELLPKKGVKVGSQVPGVKRKCVQDQHMGEDLGARVLFLAVYSVKPAV